MEGENGTGPSPAGRGALRDRLRRPLATLRVPRPKLKIARPRLGSPRLPGFGARRIVKLDLRAALPKLNTNSKRPPGQAADLLGGWLGRLRASPVAMGVVAAAVAVGFTAGITYYGARTFSRRAADTRASNEAATFARHSGTLATGDAFDGYIQMLRFADDPVVANKGSSHEARVAALQQLLYLNVNKFASLTIADRAGTVLATTDASITSVAGSQAFAETRANLSPANSDVVLTEPGKAGYVDYSVTLKEPDGATWGILVGRADPARIWKGTLGATVDGSRNVIINSEGLFAAGVPDGLLGQPWRGSPVGGGVRADIAGVDSICGLAPIGKDTQIDRGLNVASCLPISVIQAEHGAAMGKQGLVTLAASVLAVVLAWVVLAATRRSGPAAVVADTPISIDQTTGEATEVAADEAAVAEEAPPPAEEPMTVAARERDEEENATAEAAPVEVETAPPPAIAVDALTLIEAYEQRNARLSERLRESVQARLLVASTQADEAYRLAKSAAEDEEAARAADRLHEHVMAELERVREQDLRAIGQELHPGLIRLGLPGALRSLRKELDGTIEVRLDVDATADAVGGVKGRAPIPAGQRLALYRFAAEAARALAGAGATECTVALRRAAGTLTLTVAGTAPGDDGQRVDETALAASGLAAAAYGGAVMFHRAGDEITMSMTMPAREAEEDDAAEAFGAHEESAEHDADTAGDGTVADEDDGPSGALRAAPGGPGDDARVEAGRDDGEADGDDAWDAGAGADLDLAAALAALRRESGDGPELTVEVELADAAVIGLPQRKTALEMARVAVDALRAAGARRCSIDLRVSSGLLRLTVTSEGGSRFDATPIRPVQAAVEALGGHVVIKREELRASIAAELPAGEQAADAA